MKKLTAEQAQWLIERIQDAHNEEIKDYKLQNNMNAPLFNLGNVMVGHIKKIINQCTEKEFPVYQWVDPDDSDMFLNIKLNCPGDETSQPVINITTYTGYLNLFASEFKELTNGCVKICDWLREQE